MTLHYMNVLFPKIRYILKDNIFLRKMKNFTGNSKGLVLENTNKRSLNPFASACFYICPTQFRGVQKGSVLTTGQKVQINCGLSIASKIYSCDLYLSSTKEQIYLDVFRFPCLRSFKH